MDLWIYVERISIRNLRILLQQFRVQQLRWETGRNLAFPAHGVEIQVTVTLGLNTVPVWVGTICVGVMVVAMVQVEGAFSIHSWGHALLQREGCSDNVAMESVVVVILLGVSEPDRDGATTRSWPLGGDTWPCWCSELCRANRKSRTMIVVDLVVVTAAVAASRELHLVASVAIATCLPPTSPNIIIHVISLSSCDLSRHLTCVSWDGPLQLARLIAITWIAVATATTLLPLDNIKWTLREMTFNAKCTNAPIFGHQIYPHNGRSLAAHRTLTAQSLHGWGSCMIVYIFWAWGWEIHVSSPSQKHPSCSTFSWIKIQRSLKQVGVGTLLRCSSYTHKVQESI